MPPPVPPSVNAGRMMSGKRPIFSATCARFLDVVGGAADGHVQPDREHQVLEHLAVFAALDGLGIGADHLDAVLVERPAAEQGHGGVEGGLAAERRQQDQLAVRLEALHLRDFPGDDLVDALGGDRLDVGAVGKLGVGHDRGRIRVHQDDAVALFLERLAGLRARIIELARLPDDDRAGADDQDRVDVSALRHKSAGNKAAFRRRLSVLNLRRPKIALASLHPGYLYCALFLKES